MSSEDPVIVKRPETIRVSKSQIRYHRIWQSMRLMVRPAAFGAIVAVLLGAISSLIVPSSGAAWSGSMLFVVLMALLVTWTCRAFAGWQKRLSIVVLSAMLTLGSLFLSEYLIAERYSISFVLHLSSMELWLKGLTIVAVFLGVYLGTKIRPQSIRRVSGTARRGIPPEEGTVGHGGSPTTRTRTRTRDSGSAESVVIRIKPRTRKKSAPVSRDSGIHGVGTEYFICLVCGGQVKDSEKRRVCPRDGAVHHAECWKTNGGCGVLADHGV